MQRSLPYLFGLVMKKAGGEQCSPPAFGLSLFSAGPELLRFLFGKEEADPSEANGNGQDAGCQGGIPHGVNGHGLFPPPDAQRVHAREQQEEHSRPQDIRRGNFYLTLCAVQNRKGEHQAALHHIAGLADRVYIQGVGIDAGIKQAEQDGRQGGQAENIPQKPVTRQLAAVICYKQACDTHEGDVVELDILGGGCGFGIEGRVAEKPGQLQA